MNCSHPWENELRSLISGSAVGSGGEQPGSNQSSTRRSGLKSLPREKDPAWPSLPGAAGAGGHWPDPPRGGGCPATALTASV